MSALRRLRAWLALWDWLIVGAWVGGAALGVFSWWVLLVRL